MGNNGLKNGDLIVLVNPPNKKIVLRDLYCSTISKGTYNWPNVDLLVLSGVLRTHFQVKLLDANTLGLSEDEAINKILSLQLRGIVFSFGISVKQEDYQFIQKIKAKLPHIRICGTGGLLYHNDEQELREHPELDACLKNFTTDDIIKYFKNDLKNISNISYRENGKIIKQPLHYPENKFSYPIPHHDQLPLNKYKLSHGRQFPLTSIITSWGCPAKCNFCVQENINYRFRSVDNILEELDELERLDIKEIFIRDGNFCSVPKQGQELMQAMIQKKYKFSWVANVRGDVINEKTATLMKASGCHALHIGVETSNQDILAATQKKITLSRIKQSFGICHSKGIVTLGYFILGLPGETPKDLEQTIQFAVELDCDYASFNMPFPTIGTSLRKDAIEQGLIESDNEEIYDGSLEPILNTQSLSSKQIVDYKKLAFRRFYLRPQFALKTLRRIRNPFQMRMMFEEIICFLKTRIISKQ